MMFILGLVAAAIGWGVWTKKITPKQLLPIILMVSGAAIALKGQPLGGIGILVIGAAWFAGVRRPGVGGSSIQHKNVIDDARRLLGVSAADDAAAIRARHRTLILENHPDTGGNEKRAAALNEARDLLLAALEQPNNE